MKEKKQNRMRGLDAILFERKVYTRKKNSKKRKEDKRIKNNYKEILQQ